MTIGEQIATGYCIVLDYHVMLPCAKHKRDIICETR
jgi:hypothetical protein